MTSDRPKTRGECLNGQRPCPWVGCRYHLYLDVDRYGAIKFNYPNIEPSEMKESCALDVADRVAETGEEMPGSLVGHLLGGLSKQGIEQLINGEDTSHGYRRTGALDRMRKSLTVLLNGADPSFEHPESRPVDSTPKGGKR